MSEPCRNPECRNGFTPGILTAGKGTATTPVIGATMRWGWVRCRACNPDKDHPYDHRPRSSEEIGERARLADAKAAYEAPRAQPNLERVRAATPLPAAVADPSIVNRLLAQNEKLTDQIAALLEENRSLRSRLESKANGAVPENPARRIIKRKAKAKDDLQ